MKLKYVEKSENDENKHILNVASYNQLGNSLGEQEHFIYVKPKVLSSEFRENKNLELITQLSNDNLDILTIVECDNYWKFWNPQMSKLGFDSVFSKRPTFRNSDFDLTKGWGTSYKYDGVAIFFKSKRFQLTFEPITVMHTDGHDRISLICLLFDSLTQKFLLVVSTHLYWDSKKVKSQLQELNETNIFASQLIENYSKDLKLNYQIPVIFSGDFNNTPDSEIYSWMNDSFLNEQKYSMRSAYDCYKSGGNEFGKNFEPDFTTVNYKRCQTIDYIWYSSNTFEVFELLKIPDESECRSEDGPEGWTTKVNSKQYKLNLNENNNGIPNSNFGSDHILIQAKLKFK
jgi:mRNA deadenylase 3'-5' endonuclease subunit Ccr4